MMLAQATLTLMDSILIQAFQYDGRSWILVSVSFESGAHPSNRLRSISSSKMHLCTWSQQTCQLHPQYYF